MEHKPFAVIAPVAVAAILILGILAGISSTAAAQLSKLVKSPYVSKTVKSPYVSKTVKSPYVSKTVKSPYVSKTVKSPYVSKTVKSPYVSKTVKMGATKTGYRAQGASNGKKRTELTLSASPNGPDKIEGGVTWVPLTLSGRLTSEGSGVANVGIYFLCGGETCTFQESATGGIADTDSGGHYSIGVLETHKSKIEASFS